MRHVSVNFMGFHPELGEPGLLRSTFLVENAGHLRRHGLAGDARLEIVMVGNVDGMSARLRAAFDTPPCRFHDGRATFERLAARFPRLMAALNGPYWVVPFALLRWLVVAELFPDEPVLCYDGDILHNMAMPDLADAFAGRTTTATSTCFAAISDPDWFRQWERGLMAMEADLQGFMATRAAGVIAAGGDFLKNAEEFLAKILIEEGVLRQDVLPDDLPWIIPQPHLLPRLYSMVRTRGAPAAVPAPMRYARIGAVDHINGRPVAFWHLQKPFMNQLSALMLFREARGDLHPGRVPPFSYYDKMPKAERIRLVDPYFDEAGFPLLRADQRELARLLHGMEATLRTVRDDPRGNPFAPDTVYGYYFRRHDLSPLFNEATWPVPGMWA